MIRVPLSQPITVDGHRLDAVDVAWPEKPDAIGLLGISDPVDQIARTIATVTGLPLLTVYGMAFDDWQSIHDAAREA